MNTIISFGLCPFVQRSLITMNYKKIDYNLKYIDLANKPDWFLKLSPLGKVPILQVGDTVLFESAVINEYVDEISPPSLHQQDPLEKAVERAFIELSSAAIMTYFYAAMAQDQENYDTHRTALKSNLGRILDQYQGPYFRGTEFSLVDTSFIPLIQRLLITGRMVQDLELSDEQKEKFKQWSEATLSMEAVIKSVPQTFEVDFKSYLTEKNSFIGK